MKIFDIASLVTAILIILFFSMSVYSVDTGIPYVKITSRDGTYLYPLEEDREIILTGPIGDTAISIHNNQAAVTDSPCPHKICMNTKALTYNGEWTACLPNQIFINIQGAEEQHIDAISY